MKINKSNLRMVKRPALQTLIEDHAYNRANLPKNNEEWAKLVLNTLQLRDMENRSFWRVQAELNEVKEQLAGALAIAAKAAARNAKPHGDFADDIPF